MECFYEYVVAVLSTLVTLLLGWQIFTFIGINKLIAKRIQKALKKSKEEAEKEIMGVVAIQMFRMLDVYKALERSDLILLCYVDSLSLILSSMDRESIITIAGNFNKYLKEGTTETIPEKDKDRLLGNIYEYKALRKTKKNEDKTDLELLAQIISVVR